MTIQDSPQSGRLGRLPAMPGRSCLVLLDLLSLHTHSLVVLLQPVSELLVWRLLEDGLLPQVWCQVGVCGSHGGVGGLSEVAQSAGGSPGAGVAVLNTRHLQQLLGHGGRHDASTAGCGDQSHPHGAALAGDLAGHRVGFADLVTPEASSDGNNGELGQDDGSSDSSGHLLGALDTKTNVAVVISNSWKDNKLRDVERHGDSARVGKEIVFRCQESNHRNSSSSALFVSSLNGEKLVQLMVFGN